MKKNYKITMKKIISVSILIFIAFTSSNIYSQANPSAAILPLNAGGVVVVGAVQDVKVTITNTQAGNIVAFKLRPNITIPALCTILPDAQQTGLPAGWSIVSNTGNGQIRVCNGLDVIGGNQSRDCIIKVQGLTIGGPTQCQVNIQFGGTSCAVAGPQPNGNNTVDDAAQSTLTVIAGTLPLTLLNFNASLLNCKPSLNWITASETNTDRFEVERATQNTATDWVTIGTTAAQGNSTIKNKYNFSDNTVEASSKKTFYRLKMIDKDGKYKYSPVLPVFINCKTAQVNTYPNPVQQGFLNVNVIAIANEKTEAVLVGTLGQIVLKMNLKNGLNTVNVSNIANGEYLLKVSATNTISKVLIQNKK